MDSSALSLDAIGTGIPEHPALPLVVLDSSTLRKLEAKFTHYHERDSGLRPEDAKLKDSAYSFLEFLAQDFGMTLVIPRAVIRESLRRNDGNAQDVFVVPTGPNAYRVDLNTDPSALEHDAVPFAAYLDSYKNQPSHDGQPKLRFYHSTDEMLEREGSRPSSGIIILDSGREGPLTTHGIRRSIRPGAQAGDRAITQMVWAAHENPSAENPSFAVLTDDFNLRTHINMPQSQNHGFAISLRGLLKSIPTDNGEISAKCRAFIQLFDYKKDPYFREEKRGFRWEQKQAEQWFENLARKRAEAKETPASSVAEEPLNDPAPSTVVTEALPATTTEPEKTRIIPLAERAVMGPPVKKIGQPLKIKPKGGKLSDEEQARREAVLRNHFKGSHHANGR